MRYQFYISRIYHDNDAEKYMLETFLFNLLVNQVELSVKGRVARFFSESPPSIVEDKAPFVLGWTSGRICKIKCKWRGEKWRDEGFSGFTNAINGFERLVTAV